MGSATSISHEAIRWSNLASRFTQAARRSAGNTTSSLLGGLPVPAVNLVAQIESQGPVLVLGRDTDDQTGNRPGKRQNDEEIAQGKLLAATQNRPSLIGEVREANARQQESKERPRLMHQVV
jgi:hypothetical protein